MRGVKERILMQNAGAKVVSSAKAAASSEAANAPNPRRVAAGKLNRAKRKGITTEGRERLRQAALRNHPWRFSTGPRTPSGKARVAASAKSRKKGPLSVRQLRAELAKLRDLAAEMRRGQQLAADNV